MSADGRAAAERAVYDYAWALDTSDWAALASVLSDAATTDFPGYGGVTRGGSAIAGKLRAIIEPLDGSQHLVTNVRVDLRDGTAEVSACYRALHVRAACDPPTFTVSGFYRMTVECESGTWRIARFMPQVVATEGNPAVLDLTPLLAATPP